jgi:hypothetical protein
MVPRKDVWPILLVCLLFLLMISLPYLAAERAGGDDYVFAGLLQNPVDGNSYLAKMYQGWQGEWRFTLPYTDQPGEGTYLFLFYLFLGHLARISGLSIVLVFHLARIASAAFMLLALWRFFGATFSSEGMRRLAFAIAGLGSGLGWLAALAGGFTADFWVAEAYPFLASYANPHFPLGLALMLLLLGPAVQGGQPRKWSTPFWILLAGLALGIIMPFGVVVVGIVLAGSISLERISGGEKWQTENAWRLFGLLAGGAPVLFYDVWVANTHPVLSGWSAQNLTPAPPLWDILLSFSPGIWLASAGAWSAWRSGSREGRLLLAWAGLGLLLLYLPFGLQRRFIVGLYVPLAGLAALGISQLSQGFRKRKMSLAGAFLFLTLPTNLMILLASGQGIASHASPLFIEKDEHRALEWVQAHTPDGAVILAAPETSLWIPAQTGRRVVAGHPFETIDAETRAEQVEAVFRGAPVVEDLPWLAGVDYVFIGPRERNLGGNLPAGDWKNVYEQGNVTIWAGFP